MTITIPEEDWNLIQDLSERILRRSYEQEEDLANLNNLLHALHGEGIRGERWTKDRKCKLFVNGGWVNI